MRRPTKVSKRIIKLVENFITAYEPACFKREERKKNILACSVAQSNLDEDEVVLEEIAHICRIIEDTDDED